MDRKTCLDEPARPPVGRSPGTTIGAAPAAPVRTYTVGEASSSYAEGDEVLNVALPPFFRREKNEFDLAQPGQVVDASSVARIVWTSGGHALVRYPEGIHVGHLLADLRRAIPVAPDA